MSDLHAEANHNSLDPVSSTLDLASNAVRQGAIDARHAAEKTWSATSLFVSRFVYTSCYTVSYGVVFPATLLARSPSPATTPPSAGSSTAPGRPSIGSTGPTPRSTCRSSPRADRA